MKNTPTAIIISLIAALVFITGIYFISSTVINIKQSGTVRVKGFAAKEIKSDKGIFSASITVEDKDLVKAHKKLTSDREKIEKFLNDFKLTDRKIEFSVPNIEEKFKINERGFATEELLHYQIIQPFSLLTGDVERIIALSEEISKFFDEDIILDLSPPEYFYSKLDDLKLEMVGKATANATERASVIADQGKFRLGSISSVRVGIFQITPVNSTEISDYGMNDTTSIMKEIKSVVDIVYFIK